MNGSNYLFDTNAVIAYLKGSPAIDRYINHADWFGISVISIIEFYSFNGLTKNDKTIFSIFCTRIAVINVACPQDTPLIFEASFLRIAYNLKLPDAIIAATALTSQAAIITNHKQFNKIPNLQVVTF